VRRGGYFIRERGEQEYGGGDEEADMKKRCETE
jgi:hypothetical protein